MLARLIFFYDKMMDVSGVIPGSIIGLMALCVGGEVVLRSIGFGGDVWVLEASEYGLLILTMVGAPFVLRAGRHVKVDLLVSSLKPAPRRLLNIFTGIISTIISIIFLYCSILALVDAYNTGSVLYKSAFEVKEWLPISILPLTFLLISIECLRPVINNIRNSQVVEAPKDEHD